MSATTTALQEARKMFDDAQPNPQDVQQKVYGMLIAAGLTREAIGKFYDDYNNEVAAAGDAREPQSQATSSDVQPSLTFFESIALPLIGRDWRVAPCYPKKKGVHAKLVPRPLEMQSNDPTQIHAWGMQEPNANVCVYAEQREGGLLFLDKDGAINLREKYERETGKPFPKTLLVRSSVIPNSGISKGHWYFQQTPKTIALQSNIPESQTGGLFSLRVHNQYVASIGSIHPKTGLAYEVAEDYPVVPMPGDLLDWLLKQVVDEKVAEKSEFAKVDRPLIPHGQIHPWLVSRAGRLRGIGLTPEEIEPVLIRMAYNECELPLDDNKIRQVARSMKLYEEGQDKSLLLTQGIGSQPAEITPELLDKEFPAYDGTEPEELPMLIQGFMPKGVGFFGSLSGTGKTWVGLSVAKALTSGMPLWGMFPVKRPFAVLYLIPEASDASFKRRLGKMKITQNKNLFRYRTITQGVTRPLSDPVTVAMIQQLSVKHDVLVIVDTAVRFFRGGDENAAKENNLVQDSDMLRSIGANVLFLHHSPKATKDAAELTLENALRGTGDFGAMADFVYAFRRDEKLFAQGEGPEEIEVVCVKPRDFEPPLPFRLQLKRKAKTGETGPIISVIDQTGDLGYIGHAAVKDDHSKMLAAIFRENPFISFNDLVNLLKMKRELVRGFCKRNGGWKQVEEPAPGARGKMITRKRWTQGLVMAGQVEQTSSTPEPTPVVSLNGVTDGVTDAAPGEGVSVGF